MNKNIKKKLALPSNWRKLLMSAVLGSFLTAGAFAIISKGQNLKWADWTGFGEDTTKEESLEKNAKGQIQKLTYTTKYQSGKALWDWLELAGTLAVPILILILSYQFQRREQKRAAEQAEAEKEKAEQQAELERERVATNLREERKIAATNLREEALQIYVDRISELLLNRNLSLRSSNDPMQYVARVRTLTVLRRLENDGERKASVLHFLYDAELLKVIDLRDADLSSVSLSAAYLFGANLRSANLNGANLSLGNK